MDYASKLASQFADSTDNVVENATNYGPVGTTMALLEQSSKLFNAVHKRLHAAQTKDLRILTRLDYEYLPDLYPYEVAGGAQQIFKKDFNLKSQLMLFLYQILTCQLKHIGLQRLTLLCQ